MTDKNTEELAWTNGHVATFCPDGEHYAVMFNQEMMPLLREKGELRVYIKPEPDANATAAVKRLVSDWLSHADAGKSIYLQRIELASYVYTRTMFQMARDAVVVPQDQPEHSVEYRVGWFRSSSNPRKQVRCLFEGARIAEAEKHHSFIAWCDRTNVGSDGLSDQGRAAMDQDLKDRVARDALLEAIDLKAEAGLCQMTHGGTRAFLKDIREAIKEAKGD